MARTTPAQNPRGCARYTSMGRPLRKLHHIHSEAPRRRTLHIRSCNIRTMPVPALCRSQAHGSTGICVKKSGIGKGGLRNDCLKMQLIYGIIIQITRSVPHLFVTFSPAEAGYMNLSTPLGPVLHPFFFVSSRRKVAKQPLDRQVELR